MKFLITIITICSINFSRGQAIDSAWISNTYFPALSIDTGVFLPSINLIDDKGKKRSLSEFRGKILYIDVWTTWCGNCIDNFPRSKKLYERLKYIHLDTSIQFINICTEDSRADWKNLLKKNNPEGVNLYATDTTLYKTWKIDAFPRYIIVDKEGKIMSLNGVDVRDRLIDYVLYAATKNIKPAVAVWTDFRQNKYFEKHQRYTDDTEGIDYSIWYNSIKKKMVEQYLEKTQNKMKNSR